MSDLSATGAKPQRVRVFSQSVAMAFEVNLDKSRSADNSAFVTETEKYYLSLQFAPPSDNREYGQYLHREGNHSRRLPGLLQQAE